MRISDITMHTGTNIRTKRGTDMNTRTKRVTDMNTRTKTTTKIKNQTLKKQNHQPRLLTRNRNPRRFVLNILIVDNSKKGNLNLHGVFLHLLGDALGSIAAIGVGLCIWLIPDKYNWKYYFDPCASIIVSLIILRSSIPLGTIC